MRSVLYAYVTEYASSYALRTIFMGSFKRNRTPLFSYIVMLIC